MMASGPALGHQARPLQGGLHEGVGEAQSVLAAGELTEVPHVEPQVALPVEPQDPLQLLDRHPPPRGDLPAAIEQAVIALLLVATAQPAHGARTEAQDLGRGRPGALPAQCSQEDFLYLHGPLHGRRGIGHGHLPGGHDNRAACWERSNHLLSGAVRSCAPDSDQPGRLTEPCSNATL